ncbi:MAG: extracellular solute-binding protein, partial [Candidatus Margulisiibacteriota bacterium]
AENIFLELDDAQKQRVEFFIPKEGSPMYIDNMVMLKTARHKELAYQFINYIHEPEVFSKIVSFLRLPSLNTDARKFVTKSPIYQIEDLVPCELKEDLGADLVKFNKIWGQVRM